MEIFVEKIKKTFTDKRVITTIICFAFGLLYMTYIHSNISINNGFTELKYDAFYWIISIILLILLTGAIIYIMTKKELKVHIVFMVLAIIFGVSYLIAGPIQDGSDEVAHFYRVFEVATGQLLTQTNEEGTFVEKNLPSSMIELTDSKNADASIKIHDLPEKSQIELNKNEKIDKEANTGTSVYSPIVYAPQALGMLIGLQLNLKPLIIANLARIFGFVVWLLICTYAIKLIPGKKEFFLVLMLLPASITSAVTLSADTILNAFSFLLIAKVFEVSARKEKINIKDIIILTISCIIIGQCKMAYLPLIFISLLIPMDKYKNKKWYFIDNAIIIASAFFGTWIWDKVAASTHYGTGIGEQQIWILAHPINYIIVMFRTAVEYFNHIFFGIAAGNSLYQARVHVPEAISFGLMVCLGISLFIKESTNEIKLWKKMLIICIMGGIALLVVTAMYVSATTIVTGKIGTKIIEGIQGRYFIPAIALCAMIFKKKTINIDEKYLYATTIMLQFAVILNTVLTFI